MKQTTYMGYRPVDFSTAYSKYFNENMPPIQQQAVVGLQQSPFPKGSLPPLSKIAEMHTDTYAVVENGYVLETDGSIRIAILTKMPRVYPKMWDWWFCWHGSHDNRYKLWHPKAHKSAVWEDSRADLLNYIGRNSLIEEYIGKSMEKASIRFIEPQSIGLNPIIDKNKETFICARVGYRGYPIDFGYLVHHIRITEGGAEMRSRFFFGGQFIELRGFSILSTLISPILRLVTRLKEQRAKDLMTHCAEEMNHLAQFLPDIYNEFS